MALKGVKVIELAGLAPAPFCGMILADFGASVIKIDRVEKRVDLDCLSNGKRSMLLNLKESAGISIFRKLCKTSDVLIEPYRKGVMESLGLGPDVLLKDNPKLVYARLTGYGQGGLYGERAGHDINYLSLSGLLSLFGRVGEKPYFPINTVADFAGGGLTCALGIILALFERTSSGFGQVVDNSMVEGSAYVGSWLYRSQHLPIWGNARGANILDSGAHFYEVYETKDGKFMAVGAIEPKFYEELLKGLKLTIGEVPHFENFEESKKILKKEFLKKTRDEWVHIFEHTDACVTPVLSVEEAPQHPHNKEQNSFGKSSTRGQFVPGPAPKLSRTPGLSQSVHSEPIPGQDTVDILHDLGYTSQAISQLEEKGIIHRHHKSHL